MERLKKVIEWYKSLTKTKKFLLFMCIAILVAISGSKKPKASQVFPQLEGNWYSEISKNMGGMKATLRYDLNITKNGNVYEYTCEKTFIDEYSGNIPDVSNFEGSIGEIINTGDFQGKATWGVKLIGGEFGEDKGWFEIGTGEVKSQRDFVYISFPKGKRDAIKFERIY